MDAALVSVSCMDAALVSASSCISVGQPAPSVLGGGGGGCTNNGPDRHMAVCFILWMYMNSCLQICRQHCTTNDEVTQTFFSFFFFLFSFSWVCVCGGGGGGGGGVHRSPSGPKLERVLISDLD